MSDWQQRATTAAEIVYDTFMKQVLETHVLADRAHPMSEPQQKRVVKGTHINPHPVRLMTISGKGGWNKDPEKAARYAKNMNITLLDHLLSVVRGSLVLASLDWLAQNPEMEETLLKRRLAWIAAIAFMHDLDKDLQLPRNSELTPEMVAKQQQKYGLTEFLSSFGVELNGAQLLYLLEKVEATQSHRHPPSPLPPRETEILSQYVRLADKLDGVWASSDPEKGGIQGVLKRLQNDEGSLHSDFLREWQALELFDPHHPFLLDELQRWLSFLCRRITGFPPLLEMHLDGRLVVLLPTAHFTEIIAAALEKLCATLPFQLELDVSVRGVPALYNGQPTYAELQAFIQEHPLNKSFQDLFRIKASYQASLTDELDGLLDDYGLSPRFPTKTTGASVHLYSSFADLEHEAIQRLRKAAHLILLLNLKVKAKAKDGIPEPEQRETLLLQNIEAERPAWIEAIADGTAESASTRRIVTALWATVASEEDDDIHDTIWEAEGLLQSWLEGNEQTSGFNRFITGKGAEVSAAVQQHFRQLLQGERISVDHEKKIAGTLFVYRSAR